jgi:argininosuccinate synthase
MDIRKVLKKIERTETPKVNKVAVAYSGGLDSSLAGELLRRKYDAKMIVPITMDVGQGEKEIAESRRKAKVLKIKLYKGNVDIVHRESRTGLFSPAIRSIKATGFDQRKCADAAYVRGLPFEILAKRKTK